MPKLGQFPVKDYIKAARSMAKQKGFDRLDCFKHKNAYRFEVFISGETLPANFWTIHVTHDRKELVWSRDDYRKPDINLNGRSGEFVEILEKI